MIRLQDIMSTDVKTVAPNTDAAQAWSLMQQHDIHHLVVVDGREVAGVISARDLGGSRGTATRRNQRVSDLMVGGVVTAKPSETLRQAANKLRGNAIGCLPIVEGGKVVGIITITDCLELIGHGTAGKDNRMPLSRKPGGPHVQFAKTQRR